MDEVWNVFYLDGNDCLYLIGNYAMEDCKHIIYEGDTTELINVYLDENGNPNYKWDGEKLVELTSEEKEMYFPKPQPSQLDRIEESIKEINTTLSVTNEYKQAYETLTDGAKVEPLVMRKNIQALFASADSTSIVNAEPFVDEWKAGTMNEPIEYKIGDVRKENGQVYECKQAHTHHGEEGWNPSLFKAGWIVKHTKDKTNPKPYIQPQGSHDAYMKDECISWNGKVYVSKVDSNVYSPSDYPDNWYIANV